MLLNFFIVAITWKKILNAIALFVKERFTCHKDMY
jgi:hypothetical protein